MFPYADDNRDRLRRPVVTIVLIAINVVAFLYTVMLPTADRNFFVANWGVIPVRITQYAAFTRANPEITSPFIATLFTSMFLHGGWWHIIGNMLFLWVFGDNVEDRIGPFRFVIFYIACGLVGNVTHIVTNINSLAPSIGASGAIAGVLGGYIVLRPRGQVRNLILLGFIPIFVTLSAWIVIGYWFVLQAFNGVGSLGTNFRSGGSGDGVAYWAHIGGFLAGVVLIKLSTASTRPLAPYNYSPHRH